MAQIHWASQVNGSFQTGAFWSGRKPPGPNDDAVIDAAGGTAYTVTSSAAQTVLSIQLASTATLSITVGAFVATTGTGSGANVGAILVGNSTSFTVGSAVDNTGLIALNAGANLTDLIIAPGDVTFSGGGQITLGDSGNNRIVSVDATSQLTNVDNVISGAGQFGAGQLLLDNQAGGVIDATGKNALFLSVGATAATNEGLMEATGAGGLVIQNSTIDGSGGGTIEALAGSSVQLQSADIVSGTLAAVGSGVIETTSGVSTLDGSASAVTNQTGIDIGNNTSLTILGAISNAGAIDLDAGANLTNLIVGATATLSGRGQIVLGDNGNNRLYGVNAAAKLTNVDNTISGAGQLGVGQLVLINQTLGVIDATGTNALVLNVGADTVANTGLIEATGAGGLTIAGAAINNVGGVISAGKGSVVSLQGADILGGTVTTTGTGAVEASGGGSVLDGRASKVTIKGKVEILNNSNLTIEGTIVDSSAITTNAAANLTDLIIGAANATLTGAGAVVLNDDANNRLYGATATAQLTNVNTTISGAGQLGVGGLVLQNQAAGVIDATGANALILNVGATAVVNAGLLEATGAGGLVIQNSAVDSSSGGTILAANASQVDLTSADIIGGTLSVAGTGVFQTTDGGSQLDGQGAHPVTVLAPLDIANNTSLTIQGAIGLTKTVGTVVTNGAINLGAVANLTNLVVGAAGATVTGGQVTLSDDANNRILGTLTTGAAGSTVSTLTNKTVISGAGAIGANLALTNDTTIDATGANALVLTTGNGGVAGSNTIANNGLLEATNPLALGATGGLQLSGVVVANASGKGVVEANGAKTHVDLRSATISGGVLESLGGGVIQTLDGGSILDGTAAAVANQGQVNILNNTALTIVGAISNTAAITLLAGANLTDLIVGAGAATLTGGGAVTLVDDANNRLYGATAKAKLTNANNTISGAGHLGNGQLVLVNKAAGVIDATGTNNALILNVGATAVVNAGLIEATGAAGLTIQNSAIDDSGGGKILAAKGSVVDLQSADLIGGVLEVAGSGVFQTVDGGTVFDGSASAVNNQGVVDILNGTSLTIQGSIQNTGLIASQGGQNLTDLVVAAGGATLAGAGAVTLDDDANNRILGASAAATLTNVDNTLSGAGQLGAGQLTLVNQAAGVIDATGTSNALVLNTGANVVTNLGLIEATGAAGLTVQSAIKGGATGVLSAGAGSQISLQSADIIGGVLKVAGSGYFQTIDGGTLFDGSTKKVVNQAKVDLDNNTTLTIKGAIDNIGTVFFNGGANLTDLFVNAAGATLSGGGHVTLNDDANNRILGGAVATTLTNVNNVISGAGQLGAGVLTLVNQTAGVIDATGANALVLNTGSATTTNAGLIEATGVGGLTIVSPVAGGAAGEILAAAGSHVSLQSADIISGVLKTAGTGFFQTTDGGSLFDGTVSQLVDQAQVDILNNTALTIEGAIANSGQISLAAGANLTDLIVSANNAALSGGGQVTLADTPNSRILGQSVGSLLDNVDNTISGAGQLGAGQMTLVNEAGGVIDATGGNSLVVNTGANAITNIGLMEATAAGGLTISSSVANTGLLEANGGNVVANAAVAGSGSVLIVAGTADFNAAFSENVTFNAVAGGLKLAQSQGYTGKISGFSTRGAAGADTVDLADIGFVGASEATFSGNTSGGVLTVTDGVHTASISLVGDYTRSTFLAAADGANGTLITVNATTPIARADTYTTGVGKVLAVTAATGVLANDVDPNGLALTAALAPGGGPAHGTLTLNANGSFKYTPNAGFSGKDSFTYIAKDAVASARAATVTITVGAAGIVSNPDAYGDGAGQALTTTAATGVLANDTDPNGLALTAALAPGGGPSNGTLTLNANGSFTYTPTLGFAGKDTFSYIASDGVISGAATLVTITVTAGTPTTKANAYGDGAGQILTTTAAAGVLANDTDPNGLALTAALAPGGGPSHGTLALKANGSFTYTPNLGFAGKDTFSYIASDSLASSAPTTVTITVTAGTPTSKADTYADAAGQPLTTTAATGVLANDTDPNGLALTAALAPGGGPGHGTLTLNANGAFTYTPTKGFTGKDTFTYIASDSLASGAPTTVTINISGGGPVSKPDAYGDGAGQTLTTTAANGVLANDTDPSGLALTAALAPGGGPSNGTLTLNANGSFTYTPTLGFAGKDTFSYIASDSVASGPPTLVTITVTARAPNSAGDGYSDYAGQALTVSAATGVLANDTDPNGLALTAALAPGGGPSDGTLTLSASGAFSYTPAKGFVGTDRFTYIASDALASGAPTTVVLDIVGRAPVTMADTYAAVANHTLTVDAQHGVLANDTDLNGRALTAALAPGGGPTYGVLTLNPNGSFSYILNSGFGGFSGTDSFTYIASDGADSSAPTLVTIHVTNGVVVGAAASARSGPAPAPAVAAPQHFIAQMATLGAMSGGAVAAATQAAHPWTTIVASSLPRSALA